MMSKDITPVSDHDRDENDDDLTLLFPNADADEIEEQLMDSLDKIYN